MSGKTLSSHNGFRCDEEARCDIQGVAKKPLDSEMIDCHACKHYYVTWDKEFPHGCRAMGFMSRQLPSLTVRSSTPKTDCLSFKRKERRAHRHEEEKCVLER